jgi:hypothetical protein
MGLWKTPFTAHGKARVRLSHVLQTAFPTAPKEQPVTHIPTNPNLGEIQTFYGKADKFSFCRIKSLDFILYIFWIYYHRMQEVIS